MVKARKFADKERLMFWFNVRVICYSGMQRTECNRADQDVPHLTA